MDKSMSQQYFSNFGVILIFIVSGLLFVAVSLLVSRIIRPNRPNEEKLSTYESGEQPIGNAWTQFNIRFYIVALAFVLFEVELIFLFPWSTIFASKVLIQETNGAWGWFALVEMIIFIAVLGLGLAYVWVNGHLDWVKPSQKIPASNSPVPGKLYDLINEKYS